METTIKRQRVQIAVMFIVSSIAAFTVLIFALSYTDPELSLATQWFLAKPTINAPFTTTPSSFTSTNTDTFNIIKTIANKSYYNSTLTGIKQLETKIFYLQKQVNNISQLISTNYSLINTFATVLYLTTNLEQDLLDLRVSLNYLNYNFLKHYNNKHYSITILHESLSFENMTNISHMITFESPIYFVQIEFSFPLLTLNTMNFELNKVARQEKNTNSNSDSKYWKPWNKREKSLPYGYQHMCHLWFNCNKIPFINDNFKVYMRLDTDSWCKQINMPDYFQIMKNNSQIVYMYNKLGGDAGAVIKDLWKYSNNFVDNYSNNNCNYSYSFGDSDSDSCRITKTILQSWMKMMNKTTKNRFNYDTIIPTFFTNFEIVRLSLFETDDILEKFSQFVDKIGGIYKYRWGDAPLRLLQIAMTSEINQTQRIQGCTHGRTGNRPAMLGNVT